MKTHMQYGAGALLFALLAAALAFPSVNNGFCTDDHFMRALYKDFPGLDALVRSPLDTFAFSKGNVQENEWLRDKGVFPWWAVTNAKLWFFRPLASLTHWFDYRYWGDYAVPMHIQNMVWFALMAGLAFLLFREFAAPAWGAWLAAFIYATDEIHGQAVGWISSRNTLMVACASMLVLIAHHRWRTTKRDRWAVAAFFSYGAGLLCGEGAIGVCAYLFAYAMVMGFDTWRARMLSLAPYAGISIVYLALYRYYGFGSAGSDWYADPGSDPAGWLRMLGINIPLLFFTELLVWPSVILRAAWPMNAAYFAAAIAIVAAVLWTMRPLLRSSARARFWLIGSFLAIVPVSAVVTQPRVLTVASIGAAALIAEYLSGWFNGRQFAKLIAAIIGMTLIVRVMDATLRLGYGLYPVIVALLIALLAVLLRYGDKSAEWLPARGPRRFLAAALLCVFVIAHLVIGPNTLTVQAMVHGAAGRKLDAAYATLPSGAAVANRDLMVLQGANDFTCYYSMLARSADLQLMPAHMRMLASSFRPMTVERPDASTLVLRTDDGFVADRGASIYRSRSLPMKKGDTVKLTGVSVTVLSTDAEGWPMEAAFIFDKPLDDDQYLWYSGAIVDERNPKSLRVSKVERYFQIPPPEVGEKVRIADLLERSAQYRAAIAAAKQLGPSTS